MNIEAFSKLHQQVSPLLICNVWDAASAKMAEKLNFKAVGTSSAALANMLGYNDGEEIEFEELLFVVKRIAKSTALPLSVDIESGFSLDPIEVANNIEKLVSIGVVGINIEDSQVAKSRTLVNSDRFAEFLSVVRGELNKNAVNVFINVRTDTFLLGLGDALIETQKRIEQYQAAGVDGFFIPCITEVEDIKAVTAYTDLPVNVMCMPNLPDFETLRALGVKRISMGNFLFDYVQKNFEQALIDIERAKSFKSLFN